MNLPRPVFRVVLVLGLATTGPATLTMIAQDSSQDSREVASVVEQPSVNGDSNVLLEVEDETVRIDAETSRRTRREYGMDADGGQRLVVTIEEDRVASPDGGLSLVRSFAEPDVNGMTYTTRRETEETVSEGGGVFSTQIEVSIPGVNRGGFVPTERVEQVERRDGGQVLELHRTTYTDPTGRGTWEALERRIVNRDYGDNDVQAVESIYTADYTADAGGTLVLSSEIVSREWTGSRGREYRTEEIFATAVPGQVNSQEPRLVQQVEVTRTPRSGGGWRTTREVKEVRGNRLQVVERATERSRPDGRGGTLVEQETAQLDVNGQLQIVNVSRTRDSGPD